MLEELRAFLAVAKHGTLRGAATATNTARTTLRRRLQALEAEVGLALLRDDGGGSLELTEAGRILRERGQHLALETDALLETLRGMGTEPVGTLSATLPLGAPPELVAAALPGFVSRYPELRHRVRVHPDPVSTLLEGSDIAFHLGRTVPEGPWVASVVLKISLRLQASASYLATHGTPTTLAELAEHSLLCPELSHFDGSQLPLHSGETLPIEPLVRSPDMLLLRHMTQISAGIGLLPAAQPPGASEALVQILPDKVGVQLPVWAVMPEGLADLPKVRMLKATMRSFGATLSSP